MPIYHSYQRPTVATPNRSTTSFEQPRTRQPLGPALILPPLPAPALTPIHARRAALSYSYPPPHYPPFNMTTPTHLQDKSYSSYRVHGEDDSFKPQPIVTSQPYTPCPHHTAFPPSSLSRTHSNVSMRTAHTVATPPSPRPVTPGVFDTPDNRPEDNPIIVIPGINFSLAGIQAPSDFPGPYPVAYLRQGPVPTDEREDAAQDKDIESSELKKSNRQGASSRNPWDYMQDAKDKQRRRFQRKELEALEVLWSIAQSPSKYQRQRLGGWLGVPTKHITVWFQNRRQETKRHSKDKAYPPSSSSRANRGTYDPVTGKWRPVPISCISSVQPPPPEKLAAVNAITLGEITREDYFNAFPGSGSVSTDDEPTVRPPFGRNASGSLDEVLRARECVFGDRRRAPRRGNGDYSLQGEGEERNRAMLALMSSSPPSMGMGELHRDSGEDEDEQASGDDLGASPPPRPTSTRPVALGRGQPSGRDLTTLGRATSLDLVASSSRARQIVLPEPPRSVSGPTASLSDNPRPPPKMFHPVPSHDNGPQPKRPRVSVSSLTSDLPSSYRPQDSFSRSQSDAVNHAPPTPTSSTTSLPTPTTTPFTRTFSFSSATVFDRNHDAGHGAKVYASEDAVRRGPGDNETDKEVLDAAQQLIEMLGGNR